MSQPKLFSTEVTSDPSSALAGVAGVAIDQGIDQVLDYAIPRRLAGQLRPGQRVKAPLGRGNRPVDGYVVSVAERSDFPRLKPILGLEDPRPLLSAAMLDLARWISRYYVTPLGTVIDSVIPSAVKKQVGLGRVARVRVLWPREQVQDLLERTRTAKRRAVLSRLLQIPEGGSADLVALAGDAGVKPATVRKLAATGVLSVIDEPDYAPVEADGGVAAEPIRPFDAPELNDDQRKAVDELLPVVGAGGFSVSLIQGVTGSGKTEVYLRCIRRAVEAGKQAIVLVPEIVLTPQTVRRFTERFGRVAVLHSGLTQTQRHHFWRQVAGGWADVVIGARSAVFAPTPRCGVIVIDEEHEGSYKQDQAPRYHAREVAIKRAQIERIPLILGSATPSLESWTRARQAPPREGPPVYRLLTLPRRVRGLALPRVELIDMRQAARMRRGIHLLSPRLEHLLRATVERGQQAILLLNRRGYSNFVYCASCGQVVQCRYCDTTMTYHRSVGASVAFPTTAQGVHTGQLHCHYCLAVNPLPQTCEACGRKLSLFGLGTQRVEEELGHKLPQVRFARVDSDTMQTSRDYERTLEAFGRRELDVLLGTQIIAKGLDYPNVTLVGVVSADTALALPDFRAAERTFQLITQVAGRAGRGDLGGLVVVQTFQADDPTIRAAVAQDFDSFAGRELAQRRSVGLPPYMRMVRIVQRDTDLDRLHESAGRLAGVLAEVIAEQRAPVVLKGPMPCAINRIAGYHRSQIVLESESAGALQTLLAEVRRRKGFAQQDRTAVDVDPVSLL
mgnify:CR=1 FL=1